MADLVKVTINGKTVEVDRNSTIMEAATVAGVDIPRLCFLKDINETSACRICVVEIDGIRTLKNSCTVKVNDGMVVRTNTERVKKSVVRNLQLLAGNHKFECWKCPREHNCEFLKLLRRYNVENVIGESSDFTHKDYITNITDSLVIDSSKCVLCGRCISTCEKVAGTSVLNYNYRGFKTFVGPALNHNMDDSGCIYCGKCIQACPVGAIKEKDDVDKALDLLDSEYYTVAQVAPAVRSALAEEFGNKIGTNAEGKMYRALKDLGFDDITDVNFGADVTIMEEGTELINRLQNNGVLPLFTSCSPGWIRYIELNYPEYLPNLSSCKSPQQMQGALIKHYYADKIGVSKDKIRVVSFMPCIAKKTEAKRPEMEVDGLRDVDLVLTTRELARLIKIKDIDFNSLEDYTPESPLAKYTGAGVIFGATGGVMEAAIRTVKHVLEGKDLTPLEVEAVRGVNDGIKEATINVNGIDVNVAVVHGSSNVPEMMERIKSGNKNYHFIEFMACTGGCVNGGGQPIVNAAVQEKCDVRSLRASVLYNIDSAATLRQSHENPCVQELYNEFLGSPNSHKAHHLLHTTYSKKDKYSK